MLDDAILIENGYREFKDNMSMADKCYQKRVYDRNGTTTLYFINLYQYVLADFTSWELNMSFDRDSKVCPYTWIKYRVSDVASVKDVEYVARKIFENNDGISYEV